LRPWCPLTGVLQQSEIIANIFLLSPGDKIYNTQLKNFCTPHKLLTMSFKTHKAVTYKASESKDGTLFGTTRKNAITTYSKNRPVQIAKKRHFLTPDTPEEWMPSSKETSSKQGTDKKGTVQ